MSLDVYLTLKDVQKTIGSGIFIRENGSTKEISLAEWQALNPGSEPVRVEPDWNDDKVYSDNITHNLAKMACKAELYDPLWEPKENNWFFAKDIVEPIEKGLAKLLSDPDYFKTFNPSNGWGDYDGLVKFTQDYLAACKKYPEATIYASR